MVLFLQYFAKGFGMPQGSASLANLQKANAARRLKKHRRRDFRVVRDLMMEALDAFRHTTDKGEAQNGALGFFKWAMNEHPRDFLKLLGQLFPRDVKVSGGITARIGVSLQSDSDIMQRALVLVEQARERAVELGGEWAALPAPYAVEEDVLPDFRDVPALRVQAEEMIPEKAER